MPRQSPYRPLPSAFTHNLLQSVLLIVHAYVTTRLIMNDCHMLLFHDIAKRWQPDRLAGIKHTQFKFLVCFVTSMEIFVMIVDEAFWNHWSIRPSTDPSQILVLLALVALNCTYQTTFLSTQQIIKNALLGKTYQKENTISTLGAIWAFSRPINTASPFQNA